MVCDNDDGGADGDHNGSGDDDGHDDDGLWSDDTTMLSQCALCTDTVENWEEHEKLNTGRNGGCRVWGYGGGGGGGINIIL